MLKKDKGVIAVIGVILAIFGIIFTIAFSIKGGNYVYGLIATGLAVIVGVILIAWAFSD